MGTRGRPTICLEFNSLAYSRVFWERRELELQMVDVTCFSISIPEFPFSNLVTGKGYRTTPRLELVMKPPLLKGHLARPDCREGLLTLK